MANDPFRALAHPIRRDLVEQLTSGPKTVGEATRGFGVSKPTISWHLRVLEETGVVVRTIDGRTHRLRLDPAPLGDASAWIETQRARWAGMFDAVEEHLEQQKETP
jgi:DNA-binding transcriptional ArsR family regulator